MNLPILSSRFLLLEQAGALSFDDILKEGVQYSSEEELALVGHMKQMLYA